jgi:hypothetical protein
MPTEGALVCESLDAPATFWRNSFNCTFDKSQTFVREAADVDAPADISARRSSGQVRSQGFLANATFARSGR